MTKRLVEVSKTRNRHSCVACQKIIKQASSAVCLSVEDELGKLLLYFCGMDCYNEFEVKQQETEAAHAS